MKLKLTLLFVLYALCNINAYSQNFLAPSIGHVVPLSTLTLVVEGGHEGSNFNFLIAANANNTNIDIDFGDGNIVYQTIGTEPMEVGGIIGSSSIIKIYGNGLNYLDCTEKKLVALDVTNCSTLEKLFCSYNFFSSLNVSYNPNLTSLYCSFNRITSLNLSNNLYLTNLSCGYNQLTSLDVSNNANLRYFYCAYNNLNVLDISHNTNLTSLYCEDNILSDLDINNNLMLTRLSCVRNKLPISTLLRILERNLEIFYYYPQYDVFETLTYSTNVTIDYSSEADGGNTIFYFRDRTHPGNDGSMVVAINYTGIYTTQGNGVYFCEMANPKLNQNNFYSHTANTTINLSGNSSLKNMSAAKASTTSINDESSELIRIYPNPVVDVINAELPNNNLPATITLFSIDGKQLKKTETTSAKTTINMEDLKRGNYIIEIETAKEKIKRKVVKL